MNWDELNEEIKKHQHLWNGPCSLCKDLVTSGIKPLFHKEGVPAAKLLFVLIAPLKTDPHIKAEDSDDLTGTFLRKIIYQIGEPALVSIAVLCLPKERDEKNFVSKKQQKTCSFWFKKTIDVIQPQIVVSMGKVPYEATQFIESHNLAFTKAPVAARWYDRWFSSTHHLHSLQRFMKSEKKKKSERVLIEQIKAILNK